MSTINTSYFKGVISMSAIKMRGMDVSEFQGAIHFKNAKKAGMDFAIARAGYGSAKLYPSQYDGKFEDYYTNAKNAGMPIGAYWYTYAKDVDAAKVEADSFLLALKGKTFEMPVFIDVEDASLPTNKAALTEIVRTFCQRVEDAGYYIGIYASLSWLENRLDMSKLKDFDVWVAQWNDTCDYKGNYGMWQYTSSGSVNGVPSERVDLDYAYIDYPSVIKSAGLNGFKKSSGETGSKVDVAEILKKIEHAKADLAEAEAMLK